MHLYMDAWGHGYMDAWMHGYMDAWVVAKVMLYEKNYLFN